MSSSAFIERPTSGYPGYDLEEVMFDLDDPDFENIPKQTMNNKTQIRGIHIRQSKSDSILQLSTSQSFYQLENIENYNRNNLNHNPRHHSVFAFGWPNNANYINSLGVGFEELDSDHHPDSIEDHNSLSNDTTMLTIEGLRNHYNSCFTCGVSWQEEHVSLDCSECGGYSMQRPCPRCEGQCKSVWTRDLAGSHKAHKAQWQGDCKMYNQNDLLQGLLQNKLSSETCENLLSKALDKLSTPL